MAHFLTCQKAETKLSKPWTTYVPKTHAHVLHLKNFLCPRIELLDDEEVPCMTTEEPEAIPEPGDGSTLPTMPPLRADYDCALDSLAYYEDGRLVLIRPAGALQDQVIQCDLGANSTGCTVQLSTSGQTFQVFGDPTRDDVIITLRPSATETSWFPVRINTSTDYNVSFPINETIWSSGYNITNINTSDCTSTDPPPLPDPLPLGWGCYSSTNASERVAVYRPLDSVNHSFLGPVYLYTPDNDSVVEVEDLEPLACEAVAPPGYTCNLDPRYFGERLGIMLDATHFYSLSDGFFPDTDLCNGITTNLPKNTTCRNNRLYYQFTLNSEPKPIVAEFGTPDAVPCFAVRPPDYSCSVNDTGPAVASNGTLPTKELYYDHNNDPAKTRIVPCIQNTGTTPPTCVRVDVEYASGTTATIEISGIDVRLYIDGVREPMRCSSPSFNSVANTTNASTMMVQVEQYYGVHVDSDAGGSLTFEQRVQLAKARARAELRAPMTMLSNFVNAMNVTLYPKNSLVCCVSRFLRSAGRFVVALAFEIIYTARSLMTLPAAIPGYVFEVPTFRDALEEVRDAACELACTLTRIIPAEYRCDTFTISVGCTSGPSCAQGLLCHLASAVLLMAEILVEILETVRDLTDNQGSVPTDSPILGEECSINNVGNCVASVIVYVIVKVIFTVTQIARDLAANVDCLLCAITNANGTSFCTPGLFMVIDPITRLIEGLVDGVLATIIKIAISFISLLVYLFSGDIDRFVSELTNIFTLIGEVVTNFAEMVLKFFLSLPGISDIMNFFNTIISGACDFLEDAINAFADPDVDLDCPSSSKKRAILAPGWLPPLPADAFNAMSGACRAAVAKFNATNSASITEENQRELGVCYSSKYWLVDVPAAAEIDGYANDCDYRMPGILQQNVRWTSLTAEERSKAFDCTRYRHGTRLLQRTMPFVPRDLADNPVARIPDFFDQMRFAYSAFNQYRQDRLYPASTVLSTDYAANWADGGYNAEHLDTLRAFGAQDAQAMLDADDTDAPAFLTLHAYAHRAVDLDRDAPRGLWGRPRARNPEQIADAMRFFNTWFGRPSSSDSAKRAATGSRAAHVAAQFIEFALNETAKHRVLPAPSVNISDVVSGTSRTPHGYILFTGLLIDVPALAARVLLGARNYSLTSRTYTAGATTAQLAYAGTVAAFGVVRDIFRGYYAAQTRPLTGVAGMNMTALLPERTIWHSTLNGQRTTLTAMVSGMWSSFSNNLAGAVTMASGHPTAVYNQFMRLATTSPEAQLRRTRLLALMAGTRASLSSALLRNGPAHVEDVELNAMLTAQDVHAANVTCDTNYTALCANCFYLDQLVGRLETGVEVTSIYYQGNATQEPSYAFSRAQFDSVRTYLADPLATVIVGDSPDNSVHWPPHDRSWLRILGDPTPNKLRFSDLGSLLQDTVDALLGDSTSDLTGLIGDNTGIAALGAGVFETVATALPDVRAREAAAPQDVLLGWFNYLYSWIRTCAHHDEYNGSGKRFSIGEVVLLTAGLSLFLGLVVGQILPAQMVTFLGGATVIAGLTMLFGTLVIAYSWSYLCWPGLPQQLADDIMYFLVYTLFARAPWLAGGIIKNSSFTNDQAGICANYAPVEEGGYDYAHCVDEVGFKDLGYNLGFILRTLSPATMEAINNTQIIVLRDIVQLEWVQERLNAFKDTYNASDPVSYKIHNSCAYFYVFWSNYAVAQLYLRAFMILRPLIGLIASLIVTAFMLAGMAMLLAVSLVRYIQIVPMRVAAARRRALQSQEEEETRESTFRARRRILHYRDAIAEPTASRFMAMARRQLRGRVGIGGHRVY